MVSRYQLAGIAGLLLVLSLSACGGGKTSDPAQTGNDNQDSGLQDVSRTIPLSGHVDGAGKDELLPGVVASVKRDPDGLSLSVDRNAELQRLGPQGERSQIGSISPGQNLSLSGAGSKGEAVYYEASSGSGNKVSMGITDIDPGVLPCPIVFVRQNPTGVTGPMQTFRNLQSPWNYQDQAIMRLDPDGTLTQLLAISDRPMQDLEVSFDASRVMFTMREFGGDDLELFEMNIDGTNLTQLTFNEYDDGEPTYLPDGRVLFTSERFGVGDFYDSGSQVPQLFVLDRFTGEERLVHIASDGCFNPIVAHNGQLYFVSWDTRINIQGPRFNRFTIWRMDPDGTDAFPVFGSHIARDNVDCFIDVRERADHHLLCVHTNFDIPGIGRAHHENYGAGSILDVDPLGNPDFPTYRYLTPREIVDSGPENTLGRYKFPVELPGGDILVSYATGDVWEDHGDENDVVPDFGLYVMDGSTGELTKVCDGAGIWEIGGMPLLQRQVPPVIPDSTLRPGVEAWGEFACMDIFDRNGDMRQGHPKPEDGPWKVRVFQALKTRGIPTGDPDRLEFDHGNFTPMAEGPMIGEYPVAEDGSFRIRIPADTPITWELVDGRGRVAVRERMFNMVRPGETRTCAGCHARIDVKHNIDLSKSAFKPNGEGFSDLRGLFDDFVNTVVDNTAHEE
ncbi:PD40 domain-containing protein [bacterium]|nr:PD40 domain-containing protein [bacterium]